MMNPFKKANRNIAIFCMGLAVVGCAAMKTGVPQKGQFDWEAHRGGRGLMPENTIPAMKNAVDLGVTTLEMDAHISKDGKVLISHDPYFNPDITTTPQGTYLTTEEAKKTLLYTMPYDSIRKYDVGLKKHPLFPDQKKIAVSKPLLTDLIDAVEPYSASKGRKMDYNIEIKSKAGKDGINHPEPGPYAELLIAVLKQKGILNRTVIQSFDARPLKYIHAKYPEIKLSYLVDDKTNMLTKNLADLGFTPDTYSPAYKGVSKELVDACHQKHIKVLPWTVNTVEDIKAQIAMGVDGVISDFPNLFAQVK